MAELATYSLEMQKKMLEQADAYFKSQGTNLTAVLNNVIDLSDWEDLIPSKGDDIFWYDASRLTHEDFKALRASMKDARDNPDEWISFEDFSKKTRERLNERIRLKNASRGLD